GPGRFGGKNRMPWRHAWADGTVVGAGNGGRATKLLTVIPADKVFGCGAAGWWSWQRWKERCSFPNYFDRKRRLIEQSAERRQVILFLRPRFPPRTGPGRSFFNLPGCGRGGGRTPHPPPPKLSPPGGALRQQGPKQQTPPQPPPDERRKPPYPRTLPSSAP